MTACSKYFIQAMTYLPATLKYSPRTHRLYECLIKIYWKSVFTVIFIHASRLYGSDVYSLELQLQAESTWHWKWLLHLCVIVMLIWRRPCLFAYDL